MGMTGMKMTKKICKSNRKTRNGKGTFSKFDSTNEILLGIFDYTNKELERSNTILCTSHDFFFS